MCLRSDVDDSGFSHLVDTKRETPLAHKLSAVSKSRDFQGKWQKPRHLTSDQNGSVPCLVEWVAAVWPPLRSHPHCQSINSQTIATGEKRC
ncbi:hypothetical protein Q8A67_008639 [Cirrhinus molitorella]|uniref:Uncharacterized protein n=1 Tax=Cirrhinus molitorella TaxID=172907 RepID=A0AA88Q0C3_9TELE|nr:hypothetical protein Q8A67_008639 [Cirrhinus molitorella]